MGFEPMTNRLKVYCSTSWAKDSRKDVYPKQCFWVHIVKTCTRKRDFGYILSNGGPSLTWTVDKTIMSRLLWPTELKGRNGATCRTWTHNQLFTKQLHSHCAKVANRWTWEDSNPWWMYGFSIRVNTTANAVCLKPLSHMSILAGVDGIKPPRTDLESVVLSLN